MSLSIGEDETQNDGEEDEIKRLILETVIKYIN